MNRLAESLPPLHGAHTADHNNRGPGGLLRPLLMEAATTGARTIHIEPAADGWQVRLRRANGLTCRRVCASSKLGSRLSRWSQRRPTIEFTVGSTLAQATVQQIETTKGASWLIKTRLLHRVPPTLDELLPHNLTRQRLLDVLTQRSGLVLLSGCDAETTALLRDAIVQQCVAPDRRIIRLEEASACHLPGTINCVLTTELLSNLAQIATLDADVIIVGEIDAEPSALAALARQASRSALVIIDHASPDIDAMLSFIEELDPNRDWIPSRLRALIRHDDVAVLCASCSTPIQHPPTISSDNANVWLDSMLYPGSEADGCHQCFESGIGGTLGTVEVLVFSDQLRHHMRDRDLKRLRYQLENHRLVPALLERSVRAGVISETEAARIAGLARAELQNRR